MKSPRCLQVGTKSDQTNGLPGPENIDLNFGVGL